MIVFDIFHEQSVQLEIQKSIRPDEAAGKFPEAS